jgi:SAM-dependent methyltransferase
MTRSTTSQTDPFFGELYLRTTRPFLSEEVTRAEAAYLSRQLPTQGLLLDLGCGHGRHLSRLAAQRAVMGLDFDRGSLQEARAFAPVVQGDFFHLPFRDHAFAGAWAWYNSLFTFADDEIARILAELARCLAPGGRVVIQGSNPARVKSSPEGQFAGPLPDGSFFEEHYRYEPTTQRDTISRRLVEPSGRVMAATFFIRYYEAEDLAALLATVGLDVDQRHGGVDESALIEGSAEVILGAVKRG